MHQRLTIDTCLNAACSSNDYYERMLLKRDAEPEAIAARFEQLGRILHPDLDRDRSEHIDYAWEMVKEAHDTLSDSESRATYDRHLTQMHTVPVEKEFDPVRAYLPSIPHVGLSISSLTAQDILGKASDLFPENFFNYRAPFTFADLVKRACASGVVTPEDFLRDHRLQGRIGQTGASIWMRQSWLSAPAVYNTFIKTLEQTGAVSIDTIHEQSALHVRDKARELWDSHGWHEAPTFFMRFNRNVVASGVVGPQVLPSDLYIKRAALIDAAEIWRRHSWDRAPESYVGYLTNCLKSGILDRNYFNEHLRKLAHAKAVNIFETHSWKNAPKYYAYYITECEKSGVLTKDIMATDPRINQCIRLAAEHIQQSFHHPLAQQTLSLFLRDCRSAGLELT